jgi:hypothetical protein
LEGNVKSESESIALSATFTLQHLPGWAALFWVTIHITIDFVSSGL